MNERPASFTPGDNTADLSRHGSPWYSSRAVTRKSALPQQLYPDGRVQFGVFDWIDLNPRFADPADTYEQRLRVIEELDRSGYWGYHIAEHHGTPVGSAPSPTVFLASAFQRTRRLRMGPMVFLLPLYHPVRLAEEICMLDQLSRGRLELGVGRGASPFELAQFGVDAAETRAMFREALQLLLDGLRTGQMANPESRYFPLARANLVLRPYQRPYPPLWYPTESFESVPWVGQQGISLLTRRIPEGKTAGDFAAVYRRELDAHRGDTTRLNHHVAEPFSGIVRHVLVAETDDEALRMGREAWKHFTDSHGYLGQLHGRPPAAQVDFDAQRAERMVLVGSPSTVRDEVLAVTEEANSTYFASCFSWGNLSTDKTLASIDLFTRQVRPAIAAPVN